VASRPAAAPAETFTPFEQLLADLSVDPSPDP
jgi:hypothetical protein